MQRGPSENGLNLQVWMIAAANTRQQWNKGSDIRYQIYIRSRICVRYQAEDMYQVSDIRPVNTSRFDFNLDSIWKFHFQELLLVIIIFSRKSWFRSSRIFTFSVTSMLGYPTRNIFQYPNSTRSWTTRLTLIGRRQREKESKLSTQKILPVKLVKWVKE